MLFGSLPEGGWTHIKERRVKEIEMVRRSGDRIFQRRSGSFTKTIFNSACYLLHVFGQDSGLLCRLATARKVVGISPASRLMCRLQLLLKEMRDLGQGPSFSGPPCRSYQTASRLFSASTSFMSMLAMSSMDGSNGPPPYGYENAQQRSPQQQIAQQHPTDPRGYGSQPTERTSMLPRQLDTGLECGVSSSLPTTRRVCIFTYLSLSALFALLLAACSVGYNLNSYINFTERRTWAVEVAKHQALRVQMNHDEAIWEARRARHEEEERQRRVDEIKKREGLSWEGLAAARCSRYATREYTAVLAHVPLGFDALEECRNKTVNIHGRDLLPSRCEDQGVCGRVTGHWHVNFEEPGCVTWWNENWFDRKGCYSSGVRIYHSKLENLEDKELWEVMCSSTPRVVNGVHYDGPTSCVDVGQGPWGVWHIPDATCSGP